MEPFNYFSEKKSLLLKSMGAVESGRTLIKDDLVAIVHLGKVRWFTHDQMIKIMNGEIEALTSGVLDENRSQKS